MPPFLTLARWSLCSLLLACLPLPFGQELVLDLSYRGGALFSVSTEVWIDLPTMERLASLPVTLTVSLDSFRGKVRSGLLLLALTRLVTKSVIPAR